MNKVTAISKGVRMSPRKTSIVAKLVKGRTIVDALVILEHTNRRAAQPVIKTIASAKANAINNHGLVEKTLKIDSIEVTAGATMKRWKPVARGMAHPIHKRTSHIKVVVTGDIKKKPAAKPAASKKKGKEE